VAGTRRGDCDREFERGTVEMLRLWLQQSGFTSIVTGHVQDFKSGDVDFVDFVRRHKPDIFIYDVSIPYDKKRRFLHTLMRTEVMRGRKLVVTTTNKARLEELVGSEASVAIEIVGKPYDLQQIADAIKAALGR
jgi:DNA-binding NarL/FixJ family response regulator